MIKPTSKKGGQCRFCGGEMVAEIVPDTRGNAHFARCPKCSAQGPWEKTAEAAIARCTPPPAPAAPNGPAVERTQEGCRCNACIKGKATVSISLQRMTLVVCDECAAALMSRLGGILLRDEVINVTVEKKGKCQVCGDPAAGDLCAHCEECARL